MFQLYYHGAFNINYKQTSFFEGKSENIVEYSIDKMEPWEYIHLLTTILSKPPWDYTTLIM